MRIVTNSVGPAGAASDALRARGKRLTQPRRLILDIVRASEAHPSAAMVYRRLRRRLPRVSLATVYRNLRMLAAEGLLSERAAAGGVRFDGNTAPHDHFTCVVCGRIDDVPAVRPAARGIPARADLEVFSRRIEFYGRCGACRRAAGSTPARRTPWQRGVSRAARA